MTTSQDTWLVDSGASIHMTGYKEVLSDFRKKSYSTRVELGNEVKYEVKRVGFISFQLDFDSILHIEEVLYVLGLRQNLLSVVVLENKGYSVVCTEKKALL